MSFPRYPKYKDSGVQWLGQVPAHWEVCLLKRKFRSVDYGISDALEMEGRVAILRMGNIENGKVVTDDLKYTDAVDGALLLARGDLLYNRTNSLDLVGKVGLFMGDSETPTSFASYLVRLRVVDECLPEYLAYLLNTEGILGLARANAFVAIGQCNLSPSRYGQIPVAVPPRSEQVAIVEYLDREAAKIDALVAEQQRLIELLKEKRQAVISHAVTKGLNPSVPMKPSGVEWLGEVPAHWSISRVKSLSTRITSGPRGWSEQVGEEGRLFVQSGDLNDSLQVEFESVQRVNVVDSAEAERTRLCDGDVVVCITGAKTGNVAVCTRVPEPAYVNQHLCLIRPGDAVLPLFLGVVLKSLIGQTYFELSQYGLKQGLSLENIREAPVLLPPLGEQAAIMSRLEAETANLDALSAEAQRTIELLQERRAALISAAVTGQIDVRALANRSAA
jgi:type I restriction enzyme, S subunit